MMNEIVPLTQSLTSSKEWLELPPIHQSIFVNILKNVSYTACSFNDEGFLVDLLPGQTCVSVRRLERISKVPKSTINRIIRKFIEFGWVGQEMGQQKCVLTILHKETYELIIFLSGTRNGTLPPICKENFIKNDTSGTPIFEQNGTGFYEGKPQESGTPDLTKNGTPPQLNQACGTPKFDKNGTLNFDKNGTGFYEGKPQESGTPDLTKNGTPKFDKNGTPTQDLSNINNIYIYKKRKITKEKKPEPEIVTFPPIVWFEKNQHQKLVADLGEEIVSKYILKINDYCEAHGKKYENYAAALRSFMRRDLEKASGALPSAALPASSIEENKKFAEGISKKYYSKVCRLDILADRVEFIPGGYGQVPLPIRFKDHGFVDQFKNCLRKNQFQELQHAS